MKQYTIIFFITLTLIYSCGRKEEAKTENTHFVLSDTMMHMIQIDTVRNCNVDDQVSLSGQVTSNENNVVKIFPRSSGQVVETKVSLGDKVTKGQALAIIRSADIAGNYSDLNSAEADLAISKRAMENTESLYKSGIASEREYGEAKLNYQKALAAKNKVEVALHINGGNNSSSGGQYTITSPTSGYIIEKKVNSGSYIRSDMGDNLFTISDLKNVWVYANVYEADIPRVKEGYSAKVTILAYPDKVFEGKIDKVSEVLDPQSKALRARITLDNSNMLLKPDMFAKVIVGNREGVNALCIPTSALISQDGKNYVVVYNSKDDLKAVEIGIIKTVGDKTYVNNGIQNGQRLVIKNQLLIFNQLISSDTK